MNKKIKLYAGCVMNADDSFNIPKLINKLCLERGLDSEKVLNEHIFRTSTPTMMSENIVNTIYNMGDVGMNTCCGEGFGLTTLEHLFFNKPQIVSAVPALKETLGENAMFVEPKTKTYMFNYEKHGGDIMLCDPKDFTKLLDKVYKERTVVENGNKYVQETFTWTRMYDVLKNHFNNNSSN